MTCSTRPHRISGRSHGRPAATRSLLQTEVASSVHDREALTMAAITTTARTSFGRLRGVAQDGVVIFRGIPYARPPVGNRRFAPPLPPDGWTGTRDAIIFGPPAMQAASAAVPEMTVASEPSED